MNLAFMKLGLKLRLVVSLLVQQDADSRL